jgi:hypothetical protein
VDEERSVVIIEKLAETVVVRLLDLEDGSGRHLDRFALM